MDYYIEIKKELIDNELNKKIKELPDDKVPIIIAGGSFNTKSATSKYVAEYAINKMLKGKLTIIPGFKMKVALFFSKFISEKLMLDILMAFQKGKEK